MPPRPPVSVIIPARNEEMNIARVVRSLAKQQATREIVVVDDQSTDRTGIILEGLRAEVPSLRILQVDSLPEGWLGKAHAAASGARVAAGDWLLFTDADTEHLPGSLAEHLARAEREGADLLSLSPGQETPTWWEKAVIPEVYVRLASLFCFEEVSDPQSRVAAANGQYILVRKDAYERSGGHEAIRAEILEDVELARRIKSGGGKLIFLPGAPWVRTRMYRSFPALWQGWTKNLYLLYAGNVPRMLAAAAQLWIEEVVPALALVAGALWAVRSRTSPAPWLVFAALLLFLLAREWRFTRAIARLGFRPLLAVYHPLGAALVGALILSSLRAHLATGRIEWKGRYYATKGQ